MDNENNKGILFRFGLSNFLLLKYLNANIVG